MFPEREYPSTKEGLLQLIKDDSEMVEYFIKGLDMGGTQEGDFSEDGFDALKSLAESEVLLRKFGELLEKEEGVTENDFKSVEGLEGIIVDCYKKDMFRIERSQDERGREEAEVCGDDEGSK